MLQRDGPSQSSAPCRTRSSSRPAGSIGSTLRCVPIPVWEALWGRREWRCACHHCRPSFERRYVRGARSRRGMGWWTWTCPEGGSYSPVDHACILVEVPSVGVTEGRGSPVSGVGGRPSEVLLRSGTGHPKDCTYGKGSNEGVTTPPPRLPRVVLTATVARPLPVWDLHLCVPRTPVSESGPWRQAPLLFPRLFSGPTGGGRPGTHGREEDRGSTLDGPRRVGGRRTEDPPSRRSLLSTWCRTVVGSLDQVPKKKSCGHLYPSTKSLFMLHTLSSFTLWPFFYLFTDYTCRGTFFRGLVICVTLFDVCFLYIDLQGKTYFKILSVWLDITVVRLVLSNPVSLLVWCVLLIDGNYLYKTKDP